MVFNTQFTPLSKLLAKDFCAQKKSIWTNYNCYATLVIKTRWEETTKFKQINLLMSVDFSMETFFTLTVFF